MTKNKSFIAPPYVEPACKIIELKSQHVLCVSPDSLSGWGNSGGAGEGFGTEGGEYNL